MSPNPDILGRSATNWLINVLLYFIVIPAFYILTAGIFEHSLGSDVRYWPLAYIFTTPAWPLVIVVVPCVAAADATYASAQRHGQRLLLAVTGAVLMGAITAIFTSGAVWPIGMAAAGFAYGLVFRSTHRRAPRTSDDTASVSAAGNLAQ